MKQTTQQLIDDFETKGWAHAENVYDADLIKEVCDEMEAMRPVYEQVQKEQGIFEETENAYHHTAATCPAQLKFLDPNPLDEFLTYYFSGKYILNTMGATYNMPSKHVYTQNIHRDIRSNTGAERLMIITVLMLDDSTLENGATWILEGSQTMIDRPSDEYFYEHAIRAPAKAGDVLLFDSNIWHAGGANQSDKPRRILTPCYAKPFIKQQLDYPRAYGYDFAKRISPELKQVLGYNALTPVTIDEFYKPRERRFYKPDQG